MYNEFDQYGAQEIQGLPPGMGPGVLQPPMRGEGMSNEDYIAQLIAFHTTPKNHQEMKKFDGGMTYGPSREATVRPDDLKTASGLMDLMAALNAEKDAESRRELALGVLGKPMGGGEMTSGGGPMGGQGGEFGGALPRAEAPPMGQMVPSHGRMGPPAESGPPKVTSIGGTASDDLTSRESARLEGADYGRQATGRELDIESRKADAYGDYYGSRAGAARQLSGSEIKYAQEMLQDIDYRLESDSVTEMEKQELLQKKAKIEAAIVQALSGDNGPGGPGAGGGAVRRFDENGNPI